MGIPPERLAGHIVSLDYFSTLGMQPLAGRLFDAVLDAVDGPPSVVVSERFWRTRLNRDPAALDRPLYVNGIEAHVIGVAPKEFVGVFPLVPVDLFLPLTAREAAPELAGDVLTRTNSPVFRVVFRLAAGQTPTHAADILTARTRQLDIAYGRSRVEDSEQRRLQLLPAGSVLPVPADFQRATVVFYGLLVMALLSLTCANLAGLTLARGDARRREIAIRLSLGASRPRLVRQLLTESVILALTGGAAGLAAAYGFMELLTRMIGRSGGLVSLFVPDLRAALLTFVVSAVSGLLFGLSPAIAATRPDLSRELTGSSKVVPRWRRRFGLRNLFIGYQMTAAASLAFVIGLLVAGIQRSGTYEHRIESERVHLFSLDLARGGNSTEEARALFLELRERLSSLSGVEQVSFTDVVPLASQLATASVAVPERSTDRSAVHRVATKKIGPAYLATLGAPLLRGVEFGERNFVNPSEAGTVPVVINHTAARELFGEADPLGRIIRADQTVLQVVGVARYGSPSVSSAEPVSTLMLPFTVADLVPRSLSSPLSPVATPGPLDLTRPSDGMSVVVRGAEGFDPASLARELGRLENRASTFNRRTLEEGLSEMERGIRYGAALYSILGIFAIGLSSVGIAGVTAQAVVGRRREIGVRLALGGRAGHVLRLVMKEGMVLVLLGVVGGLAIGFAIARLLASLNDQAAQAIQSGLGSPLLMLRGPMLLIVIAALACYLPARRSSRVDPLQVLKED
jgi:predicted permease